MQIFLEASKSALADLGRFRRVKVVLGNCTCDLDSAVSALAQGFLYYRRLSEDDRETVAVIPLMNISEREFRVKTEVLWFLRINGIPANLITFRDQIDLIALAKENRLQLTLVDHHALSTPDAELVDSVVEVIDHRPQDPAWLWPNAKLTLDPVGSCASIVANNIFAENPEIAGTQLRNLLRGPILVDTHNFSTEAGRARTPDFEAIRRLESPDAQARNLDARDELYARILEAKTDVSELTASDLLVKDMKIVDDVAIPGFPILVEKFIELPNALEDVVAFARDGPFALVVLLGMDLKGERMRRDIGVFAPRIGGRHELATKIVSSLVNSTDPSLGLHPQTAPGDEDPEAEVGGYRLLRYRQENVQATRKQILPIIQRALAEFRCQC